MKQNESMTITEFLEARIAEDEAQSNRQLLWGTTPNWTTAHHRVLAECAAKRAIIGMHRKIPDIYGEALGDTCTMCTETGPEAQGYPCDTLKAIASVYASRPNYQQEWAL